MENLIERFTPLMISYSKKAGWKIETEDMVSILTIKLITLAKDMKISEHEGENVKFIAVCLKNHFLDVVRKINQLDSREEFFNEEEIETMATIEEDNLVFEDMIKELSDQKKEIICLKFKEMYTDQEIAQKIGISRQAVNKNLRNIYKQLTTNA